MVLEPWRLCRQNPALSLVGPPVGAPTELGLVAGSVAEEPAVTAHPGTELPHGLPAHVRPVSVLGRGGTATVWRARDRRAGRDLAVKVMKVDAAGTARFEEELRALVRLGREPHVLDVIAAGVDGDLAWLLTAFAEGTLLDAVDARGPYGASAVVSLARVLGSALVAAHRSEVIHGDVTPANVVIVDGAPVLADFGMATVQAVGTGAPPLGATPGWAAPERLGGSPPSEASDVYGLGATLWTAATTRRPPSHSAPDHAAMPRGLDALVADCCHPDAGRRPSALEVVERADAERRRRDRYCPGP